MCPFFEDRPYFGLTMFFCICPACLPAEEMWNSTNLFCPLFSLSTNMVQITKTKKRKQIIVMICSWQEGPYFGRTSNILVAPATQATHSGVDSACNGFGMAQ